MQFENIANKVARPACVMHEMNIRNLENERRICDSILGQVGTRLLVR